MSIPDEIGEWVAKAEEDCAGAIALNRRRKTPLPNLVCFHAQQCAEKYLKAFLLFQKISFPRIHDLVALLDLCVEQDRSFEALRQASLHLDPYSVLFRYPGQDATIEDAKPALEAMRTIRTFIRYRLPPTQ
jgi:HEPN domain-containing protein